MEGVKNGVKIMLVIYLLIYVSACAPLVGIKRYESGDTRIDFITGYDFGLSANGVDTVENQRGISPASGVKLREAKN